MKAMVGCLGFVLLVASQAGCASEWKIQGGPKECVQMCRNWDMDLSGMVGVGNQDATGPGATACVCQVRRAAAGAPTPNELAASGVSASTSAAIVAIEEAQRQQQQQAQTPK